METRDRATTVTTSENNNRATTVRKKADRSTTVQKADRSTTVNMGADRSTMVSSGVSSSRSTQVEGNFFGEKLSIGEVVNGYTIKNVCGTPSGQSTVYIAEKGGNEFALKVYKNEEVCIDKEVVRILKEEICHPAVIRVVDDGEYNGKYYTVTPFYAEGAVIDHLDEVDVKLLKERYIPQLNDALQAMHKAGIFHCDIKPHNFYFSNDRKNLVIGDFGIALLTKTNNTKKSVLGEYIPKRELQKNAGTSAYLSKEGDEYAASWVDYYALGMSILNMANGRDVYEDIEDDVIRDELMNNQIRIPDSVDPEIAALVIKLLEGDQLRRIGYDGVSKWCQDNSYYGRYRRDVKNKCLVHIEGVTLKGNRLTSTEDYVDWLLENWEWGLDYYCKGGVANDVGNAPDGNKEINKQLSKIQEAYKGGEEEIGYLLTLLKLYSGAKFTYESFCFVDFKGYVRYLDMNYSNLEDSFFHEEVILAQLENERGNGEDKVTEKVRNIFACDVFTREDKMAMLRNYFCGEDSVVIKGKKYSSINDTAMLMFDEKMSPIESKEIFNDVFFDYLMEVFPHFRDKQDELQKILKTESMFNRNAKYSLLLTNNVKYKMEGRVFGNLHDFVVYAKELYENGGDCSAFVKLLKDGSMLKYYEAFEDIDADIGKLLADLAASKKDDHLVLTMFYNATQKDAVFMYNGCKISSMEELMEYLGTSRNISADSLALVKSAEFRVWLKSCGYPEVLRGL